MGSVLDFLGEAMLDSDAASKSDAKSGEALRIAIDEITPDPAQPREWFDDERLENLAESIRKLDVLQPILVRKELGKFIIIDGERRWRAARLAGLTDMPVVLSGDKAGAKILLAQVVANANREDLTDLELAKTIELIKGQFKITGRELGSLLNRNDAQISRLMLLIKNPAIQKLAEAGIISCAEHAAVFASLDPDTQEELVEIAKENQTSISYQDLSGARSKPSKPESSSCSGADEPNLDYLEIDPAPTTGQASELNDISTMLSESEVPATGTELKHPVTEAQRASSSISISYSQLALLMNDSPNMLESITTITLKGNPEHIQALFERLG